MGQYFKAVNLDKREVVCPWCLGGGAKLWEWAANSYGAVFTLLLRKSSATGGGDYKRSPCSPSTRAIVLNTRSPQDEARSVASAIMEAVAAEGQPVDLAPDSIVGRWAGDRVVLIGDYDASKLWHELPSYRNVSKELCAVWNAFVECDEYQLSFNPMCSCQ